jgi:hypothetical protein
VTLLYYKRELKQKLCRDRPTVRIDQGRLTKFLVSLLDYRYVLGSLIDSPSLLTSSLASSFRIKPATHLLNLHDLDTFKRSAVLAQPRQHFFVSNRLTFVNHNPEVHVREVRNRERARSMRAVAYHTSTGTSTVLVHPNGELSDVPTPTAISIG